MEHENESPKSNVIDPGSALQSAAPKPQDIYSLELDESNHNRGTERGTGVLAGILSNLGAGRSILIDRNNKVIAGNQVVQAAINTGLIKVRCVDVTGQEIVAVRRLDVDLDSKMGRELSLADNFAHEVSFDPDAAVIQRHVDQYKIDLDNVGLSDDELAEMIKKAKPDTDEDDGQTSSSHTFGNQCGVLLICPDAASQEAALADIQQRYEEAKGYDAKPVMSDGSIVLRRRSKK